MCTLHTCAVRRVRRFKNPTKSNVECAMTNENALGAQTAAQRQSAELQEKERSASHVAELAQRQDHGP